MEIFDLLLSLLGGFITKLANRMLGTKIRLGYGGEIVTGLFTLIFLLVIVFLSIRVFVAIGRTS